MSSAGTASPRVGEGACPLRQTVARAVARAEVEAICSVLGLTQGNKSRAARLLGTNYTTLHIKMRRHGISAQEFRD